MKKISTKKPTKTTKPSKTTKKTAPPTKIYFDHNGVAQRLVIYADSRRFIESFQENADGEFVWASGIWGVAPMSTESVAFHALAKIAAGQEIRLGTIGYAQ